MSCLKLILTCFFNFEDKYLAACIFKIFELYSKFYVAKFTYGSLFKYISTYKILFLFKTILCNFNELFKILNKY